MKCIDELPASELRGKRVLVRAGLDLPVDQGGEVSDVFRLKKALTTLKFLGEAGARTIILTKIGKEPSDTNEPVARALKPYLKVLYVPEIFGPATQSAIDTMGEGEFVLLENLQQHPGEKDNDPIFCKELAAFGEIYVNDCFPSAHRESAGMVGMPKVMPAYAGLQFRDEVEELSKALTPTSLSFAILGGAKFETKEPLIKLLLERYDRLFITGALANDVFKARGLPIGRSVISNELPSKEVLEHPHLIAPVDVTVERLDKQARTKLPQEVEEGDKIVDIGPDSIKEIAPLIETAKFILWNGPTGLYEGGYLSWTHAIAELIAKSDAKKVIGGGDTIAAIQESGVAEDKLGFLSTGGGAMLQYLLLGTLPAIDALN